MATIKWGKQNNKQRYFCKNCEKLFATLSKNKSIARQKIWFKKWVVGKQTLQELSNASNKSARTLQRLFSVYLDNPPNPKIISSKKCYLVIDGTYFKNNFCVLNYLDSGLKYLQYYRIVERENYSNYLSDLEFLKQVGIIPFSITSDGQKGLLWAIKDVFPDTVHQRCVVHIQRMSLTYLTRNPKTEAGITLRYWIKKLHKIDNHDKKDFWISQFEGWCRKYDYFLKEKSESLSGRKWYTHKLLRRTRSLIKNALPNMFHYLDNPHISKSTNCLETKFSYLKNNVKIHRGLSKKNRRSFIVWYNYFKNNQ